MPEKAHRRPAGDRNGGSVQVDADDRCVATTTASSPEDPETLCAPVDSPPAEPSPFLLLHEPSTGLPMLVRRSAVERVDAARSPRGLEAAVFVRGIPEPIRVREQADESRVSWARTSIAAGCAPDRCRTPASLAAVCGGCVLAIEGCRR
jgi:hypothetical protein